MSSPFLRGSIIASLRRTSWPISGDAEREAQRKPEPLTNEQARHVTSHLPLVRKYAGKIAKGNQALFTELEALGLNQLEALARTYDPTKGVTFGAYAQHRLRGAMLDYVTLNRNKTLSVGGINEVGIVAREKSGRRAKATPSDDVPLRKVPLTKGDANQTRARANDSSALVLKYLQDGGGVRYTRKQTKGGTIAEIERLLPRLNKRQQAVYRGRVLTDPPLSRAELAHQLGIEDVTQISRIQKQAESKMAKWLAENRQKPK